MTSKIKILLIGILVILIVIITSFLILKRKPVSIYTDKEEYLEGEVLKVAIGNNSKENICFSSCYPYLLEKKNSNGEWEKYLYAGCEEENIAKDCIESQKIKTFEILSEREKGLHRLCLSACIGCKVGEKFREDKIFYSNDFLIK